MKMHGRRLIRFLVLWFLILLNACLSLKMAFDAWIESMNAEAYPIEGFRPHWMVHAIMFFILSLAAFVLAFFAGRKCVEIVRRGGEIGWV
jgi:hypothetical protein